MRDLTIRGHDCTEIQVPDHVARWIRQVIEVDEEGSQRFAELDSFWVHNTELYDFPQVPPVMYSISVFLSIAEDLLKESDPLAPDQEVLDWLDEYQDGYITIQWQ
jgi:hypothetical protein